MKSYFAFKRCVLQNQTFSIHYFGIHNSPVYPEISYVFWKKTMSVPSRFWLRNYLISIPVTLEHTSCFEFSFSWFYFGKRASLSYYFNDCRQKERKHFSTLQSEFHASTIIFRFDTVGRSLYFCLSSPLCLS